jgi:hypothetical protein
MSRELKASYSCRKRCSSIGKPWQETGLLVENACGKRTKTAARSGRKAVHTRNLPRTLGFRTACWAANRDRQALKERTPHHPHRCCITIPSESRRHGRNPVLAGEVMVALSIGYAQVSADEQDLTAQRDALQQLVPDRMTVMVTTLPGFRGRLTSPGAVERPAASAGTVPAHRSAHRGPRHRPAPPRAGRESRRCG